VPQTTTPPPRLSRRSRGSAIPASRHSSIRRFWAEIPEARLLELWREAGIAEPRLRRLSLGGGVVVWGTRT
jgi:hypothetical protein